MSILKLFVAKTATLKNLKKQMQKKKATVQQSVSMPVESGGFDIIRPKNLLDFHILIEHHPAKYLKRCLNHFVLYPDLKTHYLIRLSLLPCGYCKNCLWHRKHFY